MSTADVSRIAGLEPHTGKHDLPEPTCEARSLKRIMTDLANQIADADRRHSEALSVMQQRLGALTNTAQELREQLPREQSSVLDRIEGSMAELSNRMSGTDTLLRSANVDAQSADISAKQSTNQFGPAPNANADAAPALRSALAAGTLDVYARRPNSSRASRNQIVDNFDMVDSSPHPDDDLVDRDAADALARLYENGTDQTGMPALDAVTSAASRPDIVPDAAPRLAAEADADRADRADRSAFSPAPPATKPGPAADVVALPALPLQSQQLAKSTEDDRAWLEERFADVATKLEHSLSGLRAPGSLDAFEERFTTLEQRLTQAMNQAGTGADFSSLKAIESHVEDLNAQLVAVQTHFSRLDTIELELRSLADRLSTEELSKLMQSNAPKMSDKDLMAGEVANGMAQQLPRIEQTLQSIASQLSTDRIAGLVSQARPSSPDTSAIARMVADEISQRMPAQSAGHADPSDRLEALRATLDAFVAERRHGDEQTNTMLDTMQQAMIRLLDRMDAIEQYGYLPADGETMDHGQPAQGHAYGDAYAEQQPQHAAQSTIDQSPAAPEQHRQHEIYEPALPRYQQPVDREQPERDLPASEPRAVAAPITASGLRATVNQMQPGDHLLANEPAAPPSNANSRESYVAAARRAARMAAEAPPEEEVAAEGSSASAKPRVAAAPAAGGRKLSTVSMALLCLVLVGASFIAVKMTILAPKAPLSQPQSTAPQSAPPLSEADKRIQNLEDADGASPAPQRRSGIEQGRDRELNGLPANGGVMPQQPGFATVPAALTKDATPESLAPRSNDLPPLAIGPNSLRTAAAKGDASAEFEVGARFAEGRGVPQDLQMAVNWYQRAAAQGFAPAQYRLGSMFERGLGVKTDLARARVWYQRAAEQGIVKAMHNLAVLTAGRDTAMTDYASAGKWFRAAADFGLTDSQFNLAIMHDSGLGMERDAKEAFKWFTLAARAGDEEAARRRESLRQKLQPNEVAIVEAELANWRPKSADQNVNDPRLAGEAWKKGAR